MPQHNNVKMFTTPQSKGGSRLTGSRNAKELRNKYQTELDNAHATLVNEIHHIEGINRQKALDYFYQAQALKEDIKSRQSERKALFDTLDAQIEEERGQEYKLFKVKPQGANVTADSLSGAIHIGGLGSTGVINTAPIRYLEQYPKLASTPFIKDIINKIEQKEGEVRKKAEAYHGAVAGFNKELLFYGKNVLKCQDNLTRYHKILEEGNTQINNCRYVKSFYFKMLTQAQKDEILLQTLRHPIDKWEHMLDLFKNDLSQWQKQPFSELNCSE